VKEKRERKRSRNAAACLFMISSALDLNNCPRPYYSTTTTLSGLRERGERGATKREHFFIQEATLAGECLQSRFQFKCGPCTLGARPSCDCLPGDRDKGADKPKAVILQVLVHV
jgi:hypothetical protein